MNPCDSAKDFPVDAPWQGVMLASEKSNAVIKSRITHPMRADSEARDLNPSDAHPVGTDDAGNSVPFLGLGSTGLIWAGGAVAAPDQSNDSRERRSREHRRYRQLEGRTLSMRGNSMHGNPETLKTPSLRGAGRSEKVICRTPEMYIFREPNGPIVPEKRANKAGPR
jgi:hypothetical protein